MMKRRDLQPGGRLEKKTRVESRNNAEYFSDRKLYSRVRHYLQSTSRPTLGSAIADALQGQYNEYARRKRNAFLKSVEKARSLILREDGYSSNKKSIDELEEEYSVKKADSYKSDSASAEDSSFSDNDDIELYEDTNSINNFMSDMYKSTPKRKVDAVEEKNSQPEEEIPSKPGVKDTSFQSGHNESEIRERKKRSKKSKVLRSKQQESGSQEGKSHDPQVKTETVTFADVGGNEDILRDICQLLVHLRHPEIYQCLGVVPPSGFLLHGPPGCGKTLLANAIAGELGLPLIKVAATEVISGVSGGSEEKIRELFDKALACAPSIIFIDEIDAITPRRETASKEMERRIVAQLLTCLDDLSSKACSPVVVIGATNRPDSLDPALRRAGRFDREICLGIPNERGRKSILQVLCRGLKLDSAFSFEYLAKMTPGYVGADLTALTRDAAMTAVNRVLNRLDGLVDEKSGSQVIASDERKTTTVSKEDGTSTGSDQIQPAMSTLDLSQLLHWLKEQPPLTETQLQNMSISLSDFEEALKHVQPSAKREGFATIPDVTWNDIGALHNVREELQLAIMGPIKYALCFDEMGLSRAQGILLAGPPGCGKTLLAKAVANESGINFISVKGPELLNMYVGESERAVRQVFQRARNSAPCVIFFDELDSLCPRRSDGGEGGASVRVVNQLLTEMDGMEDRKQVFIMAATNRPDIIDPAILRPGRLDKILFVGLPEAEDRFDIIKKITKHGSKPKFQNDLSMENLAMDERCEGYSGADLTALVREASIAAFKEAVKGVSSVVAVPELTSQHFDIAFTKVRPSVNKEERKKYVKMRTELYEK